jgi:hypothetical protein
MIDFCDMVSDTVSVMAKLPDNAAEATSSEAGPAKELAVVAARARWLMLMSAVTTAIAIAAVLGVIGYRLYYAAGGNGAGTITNGTVFLPKGARVISTTIGDGRIVVTLDIAGMSEVRIYDLKTMQQTGDLRFATAP